MHMNTYVDWLFAYLRCRHAAIKQAYSCQNYNEVTCLDGTQNASLGLGQAKEAYFWHIIWPQPAFLNQKGQSKGWHGLRLQSQQRQLWLIFRRKEVLSSKGEPSFVNSKIGVVKQTTRITEGKYTSICCTHCWYNICILSTPLGNAQEAPSNRPHQRRQKLPNISVDLQVQQNIRIWTWTHWHIAPNHKQALFRHTSGARQRHPPPLTLRCKFYRALFELVNSNKISLWSPQFSF